jgi:hypothetical protein
MRYVVTCSSAGRSGRTSVASDADVWRQRPQHDGFRAQPRAYRRAGARTTRPAVVDRRACVWVRACARSCVLFVRTFLHGLSFRRCTAADKCLSTTFANFLRRFATQPRFLVVLRWASYCRVHCRLKKSAEVRSRHQETPSTESLPDLSGSNCSKFARSSCLQQPLQTSTCLYGQLAEVRESIGK